MPSLAELRASLLRDLGVELRSDRGDQAFERHQLVAIRGRHKVTERGRNVTVPVDPETMDERARALRHRGASHIRITALIEHNIRRRSP